MHPRSQTHTHTPGCVSSRTEQVSAFIHTTLQLEINTTWPWSPVGLFASLRLLLLTFAFSGICSYGGVMEECLKEKGKEIMVVFGAGTTANRWLQANYAEAFTDFWRGSIDVDNVDRCQFAVYQSMSLRHPHGCWCVSNIILSWTKGVWRERADWKSHLWFGKKPKVAQQVYAEGTPWVHQSRRYSSQCWFWWVSPGTQQAALLAEAKDDKKSQYRS